MSERLFDYDPQTGVKTTFRYNADDDSFALTYSQNVDAILDLNKADQVDSFDKSDDFWHAARIPIGIQYEWLCKHGVDLWNPDHKSGVKRLLNDPEYRYLRVNHFII